MALSKVGTGIIVGMGYVVGTRQRRLVRGRQRPVRIAHVTRKASV